MKLSELIQIIERAIPSEYALEGDPIGLHVGDGNQEIERAALALELNTPLLEQAKAKRINLFLVHHPLIYRSLKRVVENDPVQRLVRKLIKNDIALYAAHTNLDLHPQGMAPLWAQKLGCASVKPFAPKPQAEQLKIVTFVPPDYVDRVREALSDAGAGRIGEYDLCSYNLQGMGTFRGSERTDPFLGKAGNFETEQEIRLEMILPARKQYAVVGALFTSHPYEEPAYDLYRLQDVRDVRQALWIAEFKQKITWKEFERRVAKSLPIPPTPIAVRPDSRRKIKTVAISTGSGNSLISLVASLNVDVFLTGEAGYHNLWEAEERGLNVLTVGHGVSESLFPEAVYTILENYVEGIEWERM